jgi:hypothetical protein
MKNAIAFFVVLVVGSVMTGCASHRDVRTVNDPATTVHEECIETANGSTNCERHYDSKIVGGASGYVYSPYSTLTVAHPPMRMIPYVDESSAQRAMGDIPGSVMMLHPGAFDGVNRRIDQMQYDQDTLTIVVAKDHRDVKKLKKDGTQDKKSPPSSEADGEPSNDP